MSIIIFLIVLAVLILVHEWGHFAAAKQAGIRVDEFGLGFPPKIAGVKKGETEYTLNWIPFGGFVKIFGENPDEESLHGPDSHRSFVNKSKWDQAVVLAAGVTMNVVLAWVLFSISFMSGFPASVAYTDAGTVENPETVITGTQPESPAALAGLLPGDTIVSLSHEANTLTDVTDTANISSFVDATEGQSFDITVLRNDVEETYTLEARDDLVAGERYIIGITMDRIGILQLPIHTAIWEAGKLTFTMSGEIAVGLAHFIWQTFTGAADFSQVAGPVGIVGLVGDASNFGLFYLLGFTAFISLNLAVLNLLPFPALDGGRLLFLLIEKIKGTPIKPKVANTLNAIGFILLLLLMIVVTIQDVIKLF